MVNVKKVAIFVGGMLFGSAGFKILASKDAKKVYTQTTAAGGILGFGVVDNGERQLDGVLIGFEVGHRIVMALKMHKVQYHHMDAFHFHNSAKGARQLPFGVQKKIRANQLQRVGLHIKACLAAARSADYDNVEIMFMRVAVGAEAYILGQDVIFFGVFGVAVLDV